MTSPLSLTTDHWPLTAEFQLQRQQVPARTGAQARLAEERARALRPRVIAVRVEDRLAAVGQLVQRAPQGVGGQAERLAERLGGRRAQVREAARDALERAGVRL